MPRFRILIEGSNIEVPSNVEGESEPSEPIRGFFVTRTVEAPSATEAAFRACAIVAAEWRSGAYAHYASVPTLAASEIHTVSFLEQFRAEDTGYVFHTGE